MPETRSGPFGLAPPGLKRLALKRTGFLSGKGLKYEVLTGEQQDEHLRSPVVLAFWNDSDLQQMDVVSANIGIHYSYQKWFDRSVPEEVTR